MEKELEKVNGDEKKKDKDEKKKNIEEDQNKTILTEDQIYNDAQLKSSIDILKALMITAQTKQEKK